MSRIYTNEDIQQILQRAETFKQEGVSREQLIEIAAEVGIEQDILQRAEQDWLQRQDAVLSKSKREQVKVKGDALGLKMHLIPYIFVSIFLFCLNLSTTPRYFWSAYPIFGWGLGVVLHGTCACENKKKG